MVGESVPQDIINFDKLQGCGNDFVVTHDLLQARPNWGDLVVAICDRRFGVGADGLMLVKAATRSDCRYQVVLYNSDGSLQSMCGNGLRCVARYLALNNLVESRDDSINLEIPAGVAKCWLVKDSSAVRIEMGVPDFDPQKIPVAIQAPAQEIVLNISGSEFRGTAVAVGNPYFIIQSSEVDAIDICEVGPKIEHHKLFPQRTNVLFVQKLEDNIFRARTWERGAGATLACGAGACASLAVLAKHGICRNSANFLFQGGRLSVDLDTNTGQVYLTGDAKRVFKGALQIADLKF